MKTWRVFKIEKAMDISPEETFLKLTSHEFVDPSRKPSKSRKKAKLTSASRPPKKKPNTIVSSRSRTGLQD